MADYDLTPEAKQDLRKIALYTNERSGREQSQNYAGELAACFQKIADGSVSERRFREIAEDVFITRCEHHYIFYRKAAGTRAIIFAVLHKKMDLIARVRERLR